MGKWKSILFSDRNRLIIRRLAQCLTVISVIYCGLALYALYRDSRLYNISRTQKQKKRFYSQSEFLSVPDNKPEDYETRKQLFDDYIKSGGRGNFDVKAHLIDPVWKGYPGYFLLKDCSDLGLDNNSNCPSEESSRPASIAILRYLLDINITLFRKPYFPNSDERMKYRDNILRILQSLAFFQGFRDSEKNIQIDKTGCPPGEQELLGLKQAEARVYARIYCK